ncbi:hypothetical protein PG984_002743 [Apiospora sp. TS-2023a]
MLTCNLLVRFDGALVVRIFDDAAHAFRFEAVFRLEHRLKPALISSERKPPLHFHPFQEEYVTALSGRVAVEVDGHVHLLEPQDGEFCIRPWQHHRFYPAPRPARDAHKDTVSESETRVLLTGQKTAEPFQLDILFLDNWFNYQKSILLGERKVSLIQVLAMFDGGGSYLSLPRWVPFGRWLSQALGIIVGRWIGAMLGYQPFYREWSPDWRLACWKMSQSPLQRRFAKGNKAGME